ncbi:MAG TPA: hypothetical protein VFA15_02550 [Nitrososphaera sp.]|nr:hypothetical protein [Nitrososphaera sp.]
MSDTIQTPVEGTEQEQVTPQADPEMETPQTPSEEVADPSIEADPQPEQTPQEPQPAAPDYKQKFVDSAREAILQNERIKVKEAQIESLTKQDTPTDEAMRALYANWDELDPVSKNFYIKQEAQEMRQRRLEAQQQDLLARQQLDDKLDDFLENPPDQFKKLAGRETEFRRFAKRKNNIGLSLDTLAKAFLFDAEEAPATQAPQPAPREALPTGNGGP